VFAYLLRSARGAYAPRQLRSVLPGIYQEPLQHDSSEFFQCRPIFVSSSFALISLHVMMWLLALLSRHVVGQLEAELEQTELKTIIRSTFGGALVNRITCSACGHISSPKVHS